MPGSAGASLVFNVDSTKDGVDANVGDDTCATAQGKCTLRAAIDQANASPGSDEIDLPKGTLKLTQPAEYRDGEQLDRRPRRERVGRDQRSRPRQDRDRADRQEWGALQRRSVRVGFSAPGLSLNGVTLTGGRVGGRGRGWRRRLPKQ